MVFYVVANVFMPLLLALGAYAVLVKIIYPIIPLTEVYLNFFVKTIFSIELFHYIFSRSRTTIKFFPLISFIFNFGTLLICSLNKHSNRMMLLNINMTIHIILFIVFILIEKAIAG